MGVCRLRAGCGAKRWNNQWAFVDQARDRIRLVDLSWSCSSSCSRFGQCWLGAGTAWVLLAKRRNRGWVGSALRVLVKHGRPQPTNGDGNPPKLPTAHRPGLRGVLPCSQGGEHRWAGDGPSMGLRNANCRNLTAPASSVSGLLPPMQHPCPARATAVLPCWGVHQPARVAAVAAGWSL